MTGNGYRELVRSTAREVRADRVLGLAAEMAFFAVLSLFPTLLVVASLLGFLDSLVGAELAQRTEQRVVGVLDRTLTDQAAPALDSVRAVFDTKRSGLLTFATLGALVTLSGAWAVAVGALNQAYDVEEGRGWLRRRLLGLVLGVATVIVVVVILVVAVIGPLLGRGFAIADTLGLGSAFTQMWSVLRFPVMFAASTAWITCVFHYAPNRDTPWRSAIPGAIATSTLWLLATAGLHLYLRLVGDRNPLLGALGGGVIFMIWAYLLSAAVLIGGELNAVLHDHVHRDRRQGSSAAGSREAPPVGPGCES